VENAKRGVAFARFSLQDCRSMLLVHPRLGLIVLVLEAEPRCWKPRRCLQELSRCPRWQTLLMVTS